jgi:hypothetical protein
MIHRLVTTVTALAAPDAVPDERLVADCADAVRLELDCPQMDLTPAQRTSLRRLGDLLEDASASPARIAVAAREACTVLGIAPGAGDDVAHDE